jgi:hypothetical protein
LDIIKITSPLKFEWFASFVQINQMQVYVILWPVDGGEEFQSMAVDQREMGSGGSAAHQD